MRLADSHAHLSDGRFDADRDAVLQRAREAGVALILDVGYDVTSSEQAVALAQAGEGVWAAAGVHPHDASALDATALGRLRELARQPRVLAIGETGLDFYRDLSPREAQRQAFEAHLGVAAEVGKPVLVHSRETYDEVLAILQHWKGQVGAVLHCYDGDRDMLGRALDLGLYISLAGTVTYERDERLREIACLVPLDRLLIETDCPYLAPAPYRGRRNEPAYVAHVAQGVARARGMTLEELAEATFQNAEAFLGLA